MKQLINELNQTPIPNTVTLNINDSQLVQAVKDKNLEIEQNSVITPVFVHNGISFDDATISEDGNWSQVCQDCIDKFKINDSLLDDIGSGVCGVEGCSNEAIAYIDFKEEVVGAC